MKQSPTRRNGGRKTAPSAITRVKIAISLPREQVAAVQRAVNEGRAPSVSEYISRALAEQGSADSLSELVTQMRAEDGAPAAGDYAWADSVLAMTRGSRRRTKRGSAARWA